MNRKISALIAMLWALAMPASAGPLGPSVLDSDDLAWFYNRPGVTLEEVAADRTRCGTFAAMMLGSTAPSPGPYGLAGAIIGGIAAAGLNVAYVDDCMMSQGYRRYDIANTRLRAFAERFQLLSPEQQLSYVSGETPPEGVLARHWANTYWISAPTDAAPSDAPRRFQPRATTVEVFNRWAQPRWIDAAEGAAAPSATEAVVVFTLQSSTGDARFSFEHRTVDGDAALSDVEGRQRWLGFEPRVRGASGPQRFAFVVPAGIYSLGYIGNTRSNVTTFCHGALAFEANAGEVIDLGDVAIEPGGRAVDALAPAPTARLRIDQPEITPTRVAQLSAGAQAVRAAVYFNRFPRACQLFSRTYGIDMPGATFWADRASAQ